MVDDHQRTAENISAELRQRFPEQRKTQRNKLSLRVATMLDVRSANLMDLGGGIAAGGRLTDMRHHQWITRFLGNRLLSSDRIMEGFAREGVRAEPGPRVSHSL